MDVRIEDVAVSFGPVQALRGVSLTLTPGHTTVLVGPNGAGKSTLMSVVLGLVRPDGGRILANGAEVASPRRTTTREFRARLGYMPESVAFSENLTGRQVLRFFAAAHGLPASRVEDTLERVGLAHAGNRGVGGYSRGMRQRLGLGVAVVAAPDLLVLDEPTGGLDQEGLDLLWDVIREWRAAGRIVLLSTHELALIERRADTVCVLAHGLVKAMGPPDALRRQVGLPVRVRLELEPDQDAGDLRHRLERAAPGHVHLDGRRLDVTVKPEELLAVLRSLDGDARAVSHVRVEEPGLDEVYQRILRTETREVAWDA